jgi:hypothetical protein
MIVDFILELIVIALTFLEQLFGRRSPAAKGRVRKSLERLKVRHSENPWSFFGVNCLHPDLIGWQIVRILDVAQVCQENQFGVVGVYGQMSQQWRPHVGIKVALDQELADQALELEL